jgi:hypothetical protein
MKKGICNSADNRRRSATIVTWKDVRNEILRVNKEIATLIDAIDPDDSYKLIKTEYLYGDLFVRDGVAQLPAADNNLYPVINPNVDHEITKALTYQEMPLFIILENASEVFIEAGIRAVPLNLFYEGGICGIYETMDFMMDIPVKYHWTFSAGSRSIAMLPKITDTSKLKKLYTAYNIPNALLVKGLLDHWELFKYVAQSSRFSQPWKNKIVYFSEKWFNNKHNSVAWRNFKDYLIKNAWQQIQFVNSKAQFNWQWRKYAEAISLRRLRPAPYLLDQLKHLFSISRGDYPAFKVIDNSQKAAPTMHLQKALVDAYGLHEYLPTLIHAFPLTYLPTGESVYYSLSLPTLLEGSSTKGHSATTISDLRIIKFLIENLRSHFSNIYSKSTDENFIINKTKFEYYHVEKDQCGEIQTSENLAKIDPAFVRDKKNFPQSNFCTSSQFFRGCIRITPE